MKIERDIPIRIKDKVSGELGEDFLVSALERVGPIPIPDGLQKVNPQRLFRRENFSDSIEKNTGYQADGLVSYYLKDLHLTFTELGLLFGISRRHAFDLAHRKK